MLYRIIDKLDMLEESESSSKTSSKSLQQVIELVEEEVNEYVKSENNAVAALLQLLLEIYNDRNKR